MGYEGQPIKLTNIHGDMYCEVNPNPDGKFNRSDLQRAFDRAVEQYTKCDISPGYLLQAAAALEARGLSFSPIEKALLDDVEQDAIDNVDEKPDLREALHKRAS